MLNFDIIPFSFNIQWAGPLTTINFPPLLTLNERVMRAAEAIRNVAECA